ncbi:hypothetical protein JHK85_052091 [Glycine max]|nr:hypothetical protein JHK85_052091 [Glycine max]
MRAPKTPADIVTEKDLISAVENFQLAVRGAMRIEIVEFASFLDQESMPKQLKDNPSLEDEEFGFLGSESQSLEQAKIGCKIEELTEIPVFNMGLCGEKKPKSKKL